MAIKIEDEYVEQEEEVYLLDEGPFQFFYPRVKPIRAAHRRLLEVGEEEAAPDVLRAVKKWLAQGFGPDAWAHIQARLDDERDALDDDHIDHLFKELMSARTRGRPTTSSNGASRQPWKKSPTAAPSPVESDSTI